MYDVVEKEYIAEKKAAAKEFEEKKIELRENLLNDFEDKRKMIESERHSMELNGDSMEVRDLHHIKYSINMCVRVTIIYFTEE